MPAENMDCTVCVPFISLREESPTTTEKNMLLQAGLECKKIKLLAEDTEEDVLNKLTSDEKKKNMPAAGLKCGSAWPTAETLLFAILNLLWVGKQKII